MLYTFYQSLVIIISTQAHNNAIPPDITKFPVTDKLRGQSVYNVFFRRNQSSLTTIGIYKNKMYLKKKIRFLSFTYF